MRSRASLHLAAISLLLLVAGCRSKAITATKLERAVSLTFANLVRVQEDVLGGPPVDPAALQASTTCQKISAANDTQGAGTWRCTITWFVPGHAAPVRDTYDVTVTTDACYTATADGTEAHVGGPTLKTLGGATVTNLLHAFDGCFDPT